MPTHPTESPIASAHVNILGVEVSAINMQEALLRSLELVKERRKGYICVTGVHGIMEARRDPALREILNRSFLCTPDGMPTVWVGRLLGHRGMRRVYGPDFMREMCAATLAHGYRHFLYGGKPGVVEVLKRRLQEQHPGIQIVGTYTPPFRSLTFEEEQALIAMVRQAKPEILWVGLSTPKQERFMAQMLTHLDTCLMVGVGAAFDIHAGLLREAPDWMKLCGLQWLHRLALEPRRLWRRYLINNPGFLWNIALQLSGVRRFT